MKKPSLFFVFIFYLASGCHPQDQRTNDVTDLSPVNATAEFGKLNDLLSKYEEPVQTFQSDSMTRMKIVCKHGTIIHINPPDLETENGKPTGATINIEVNELVNQGQFVRAGATTVSDGSLLVSGGAFHINVTSGDQKLKLKTGKNYTVEFPKKSDPEMSLFYGETDRLNKMNWRKGDQVFALPASRNDSTGEYEVILITGKGKFRDTSRMKMKNLSKEQLAQLQEESEKSSKYYAPVALNKFGWINCDRFYNNDAPRTTVQFNITNSAEEVNFVNVWMIFTDINSVMQSSYYTWNHKTEKTDFANIPVGTTAKFLAVCYRDGKIFTAQTSEKKVIKDQHEQLTLHETNEAEFGEMMKGL